MDEDYESKYHRIEVEYWWFHAKRDLLLSLIEREGRKKSILEVGCAGGALLTRLRDDGYKHIAGIDISAAAIGVCKRKKLKDVHVMDGQKTKFSEKTFDTVVASEILEHIEADAETLHEWHRIIKPGGRLILTVPAFGFVWSEHDDTNHHKRRYSRKELRRKLRKAGFKIERLSFWNMLLFFPLAPWRMLTRTIKKQNEKKDDDLHDVHPLMNRLLYRLLLLENSLVRAFDLPVGLSLVAVARRKPIKRATGHPSSH
ncbi:MAG: class I SAM-dependent methyltransferase [archaeon]